MDIESSGINCFGKLFTLIIVLFCLFRVEDAEGCFILTDRYADNREAAVSQSFNLALQSEKCHICFVINLYFRHTGFSIKAGTWHPICCFSLSKCSSLFYVFLSSNFEFSLSYINCTK